MHGSQKIEHHGYRFISKGKASLGHSGWCLFLSRGNIGLPHSTKITALQICRHQKRLGYRRVRGRQSDGGRSYDRGQAAGGRKGAVPTAAPIERRRAEAERESQRKLNVFLAEMFGPKESYSNPEIAAGIRRAGRLGGIQ
jgi:hypothetical protein